jgi:hypothetical protein
MRGRSSGTLSARTACAKLSISLEKIGDIKLRAGDAAGALAAYEESL